MSATPVPSDDDEDFDIYADFSDCNISIEKSKQTLNSNNEECQSLKKQVAQLHSEIAVLRMNNEKLKDDNHNLSCNISILLKTASAEIERKDQTISELRKELDNFLFRRKNKKLSAGCGDEITSKQLSSSIDVNTIKKTSEQLNSSIDDTIKKTSEQLSSSIDVNTVKKTSEQLSSSIDVNTIKKTSEQLSSSIDVNSLKKTLRQHLDGNDVSTVSCTSVQTVSGVCVSEVVDSPLDKESRLPSQNNGHDKEDSLVRDEQLGNVKGVKVQNSIKEVPKKRKILECMYNADEKLGVEKPLKLLDQTAAVSNNETQESKKRSVWERLGYRGVPSQRSTNSSSGPAKESAHARRGPITAKDNLNTKSDHQTSACNDSESHCGSKNHVKNPIFPAGGPSTSVNRSSLLEEADQKRNATNNLYSDCVKISKVPDPQRVDTPGTENNSSEVEVSENLLTNCDTGFSACAPVTCDLSPRKEDFHVAEENSECVNQTDGVPSSSQPEERARDLETVQPPHDFTHEKSLPSHMTQHTSPEEASTDVIPSPCQLREESPRSLPLVPPKTTTAPLENWECQAPVMTQPPLPKDNPAPLPPLPVTSPPPTPVKKPQEQCNTPGKSVNEPVQKFEVATEEPSSIKSLSAQNSPSISSDAKDSKTDSKFPHRWSNENLLMQCPFKPRHRAKSVIVVEDKTDGKNVSSQSSECSKSDADVKVSFAPNKSPDGKSKKTPLKKSDIHENRLSDFRPHQTQRSVYSSRHLSSVKSFAQLPERRSPSELLSGRSGRIGRIERLTHGDKIRVRLRDRRSRSLSPPRRRVRQEEYRTRNHCNYASAKDVGKKILVDDQESRNDRFRDHKKTKSLSLRKKVPCPSEKEGIVTRQKSQKMADLFGDSSPEPEERTSKRVNYASKRAHERPINSTEHLMKNVSSSSSQKRSASPKDFLSRSRKFGSVVTANDRKRKESAESTATCAANSTNLESVVTSLGKEKSPTFATGSGVGDPVAISKNVNTENEVIKVRRRARSSIKLEDSEFKVHSINISNMNKPISSSTPLTGGEGAHFKHLERSTKDVQSAGDQKKELHNVVARKSENTPLYFRERTSKRSLSDDSIHDVDSMDESDESSVNADSDDTYYPKKSSKTVIKQKPTKRRK